MPDDRLQPSLLDRLTDDEPRSSVESRDRRFLSTQKLREGVKRDLGWLFNTGNLAEAVDFEDYPQVAHSVLNYGIPSLTGSTASSVDEGAMERQLRQAVWDFEPRLLRNTVRVRATLSEEQMSHNAIAFEVEGELWAQPVPLHLLLKTEFDLETGSATVADSRGPGSG